MQPDLADFLLRHEALVDARGAWANGTMPLRFRSYLSPERPPEHYISSARSVVLRDEEVLICRNADSVHVLPGGRLEPGESPEQALHRELHEECGWSVSGLRQLGFMHLSHLGPKPEGYRYLYPDFLWLIFVGSALAPIRGDRSPDAYEIEASFQPITSARQLGLSKDNRLYLDAAVESRRHA